jgi:uncharacterized protein (DUF1778 family)
MVEKKGRVERFDIRATPYAKALIKRAADRSGKSMAEFIMETVLPRAEQIAGDDDSKVLLSPEDLDRFYEALDRPPRPLKNIRRLAEKPSPFIGGE